jgi:hypothetical protein
MAKYTTHNLYVSYRYGYGINSIFTDKAEAESKNNSNNGLTEKIAFNKELDKEIENHTTYLKRLPSSKDYKDYQKKKIKEFEGKKHDLSKIKCLYRVLELEDAILEEISYSKDGSMEETNF